MAEQKELAAPIAITALGLVAITVGIMKADMVSASIGVLFYVGGCYSVWHSRMEAVHG